MLRARRACIAWALLATFFFIGWQFLTVTRNYQGNWTALFCMGDHVPVPPSLSRGAWIFRNSDGYDAQFYRDVAHDPWLRGEPHRFLDEPRLRAQRILVPALAWMLGFGNDVLIDRAYLLVIWLFVFAGNFWAALEAQRNGLSAAWALLFLFVPATLISMDRLTVDVSIAALTAGFRYCHATGKSGSLYLICAAACLSRETGALLVAGVVVEYLLGRNWKRALLFASSGAYAAAWAVYIRTQIVHINRNSGYHFFFSLKTGPLFRILNPLHYGLPAGIETVVRVFDEIALLGTIASFAVGIVLWRRNRSSAPHIAMLLLAVSPVALMARRFWDNVYGYSRPFSPLLVLTGLEGMRDRGMRRLCWLAPWAMIDARIFLQLIPQALGILSGSRPVF